MKNTMKNKITIDASLPAGTASVLEYADVLLSPQKKITGKSREAASKPYIS